MLDILQGSNNESATAAGVTVTRDGDVIDDSDAVLPPLPINGSASSSSLTPQAEYVYALALYRRPAFPGFYQILQIGDQEVLDFLFKIKEKGSGFIGGFMSKVGVCLAFIVWKASIPPIPSSLSYLSLSPSLSQLEHPYFDPSFPQLPDSLTLRRDAGPIPDVSGLHETGTLLGIVNVTVHSHMSGGQVIVMPHRR